MEVERTVTPTNPCSHQVRSSRALPPPQAHEQQIENIKQITVMARIRQAC
jgi:hypothetical protein